MLLINKLPGPTSHDIVNAVRRITGEKRVGHAGTLDPFAEGLLIVLVGREETKKQAECLNMDKTYEATFVLGEERDTDDVTGAIRLVADGRSFASQTGRSSLPASEAALRSRATGSPNGETKLSGTARALRVQKSASPTRETIETALRKFVGEIEQMPPAYSAKKIKGKKAYELARKGEEPELKPKRVKIYEIELLNYAWPELQIKVKVSSGTYIRALARDIGRELGVGAFVKDLKRTEIGKYSLGDALTIEDLKENNKDVNL